MYTRYIGIDPSINSTGICAILQKDDEIIDEHYFLIVPAATKKMLRSVDDLKKLGVKFTYVLYNKEEPSKESNHKNEFIKTKNMIAITEAIKQVLDILYKESDGKQISKTNIIQEGISYGSTLRTKSVFDLAGLNYLLRYFTLSHISDCTLTITPPSEIKKFATGMGNAKKDMLMEVFKTNHQWVSLIQKSDDLVDAYFMARFGNHIKEELSSVNS